MKLMYPALTSIFFMAMSLLGQAPEQWSSAKPYEYPFLVSYDGITYISKQDIPAGTPITDVAYWVTLESEVPNETPEVTDDLLITPDVSTLPNQLPPDIDSGSGTTPSGLTSASNEAFVMQQYLDFFGRDADEGGLTFWTGEIDAGRKERADLAMDFVYSEEYQSNVAPVVRLYFAYFNRLPDTGGLKYWIENYINPDNWTLYQISDFFAASDEFIATYGSLDNGPYVTLTYNNVFEREPDSGGYTFWKNELDTGNRTRGMAMVEHAESQEYKDKMSSEVQIVAYYFSLLRRAPDQGGFDYWVDRLKKGDSAKGLIADFLYSDEYQDRANISAAEGGFGK